MGKRQARSPWDGLGSGDGRKWGTARSRTRERRQRWRKMVGVGSEKKEGTGGEEEGIEVRAEHLFGNHSLPSVQCNAH